MWLPSPPLGPSVDTWTGSVCRRGHRRSPRHGPIHNNSSTWTRTPRLPEASSPSSDPQAERRWCPVRPSCRPSLALGARSVPSISSNPIARPPQGGKPCTVVCRWTQQARSLPCRTIDLPLLSSLTVRKFWSVGAGGVLSGHLCWQPCRAPTGECQRNCHRWPCSVAPYRVGLLGGPSPHSSGLRTDVEGPPLEMVQDPPTTRPPVESPSMT